MDRPTGTPLGIFVIPGVYARRTVRDTRAGRNLSAFWHRAGRSPATGEGSRE
jgi:hypothetical protein